MLKADRQHALRNSTSNWSSAIEQLVQINDDDEPDLDLLHDTSPDRFMSSIVLKGNRSKVKRSLWSRGMHSYEIMCQASTS